MFTGISEELGKVIAFKNMGNYVQIEVSCNIVLQDTKLGDSIMTDGVCLTVTDLGKNSYKADIMAESLKMTKFSSAMLNRKVNLERAMKLSDRLDGHIVQGHVDGVGKIKSIRNNIFTIEACENICDLVVKKGSISLDGISLTILDESIKNFSVALIPETLARTNFKYKKIGDMVNIETDIIQRFIQKSMGKKERLNKNFLLENGF